MKKVSSPIPYSLLPIVITSAFWLVIVSSTNNSALSQTLTPSTQINRGEKFACHEQNLETLTTQLLRDLPSYTNRASQRGRRLRRSSDLYSYMFIAGRPEFQPLPLNPAGNSTYDQKSAEEVEQVFFTTLARQYKDGKAIELEEFHWVFLTKTKLGWRLVLMFTQTGGYPKQQPPTPPRDSSNGTVAQGIKAWLRDCQAGSVRIRTRV
ncbi:hypothetical protein H6G76_19020 [Nostoc sp. FACHB-152]|uniref:hypothetical protein n=1 Tax=unclassified Nostoc TaxID=2593658 RepID=UPI00168846B2|nr:MULTISPECIES: hypothetical protein [unclassified Nostoc]MBD2449208.1 hypothetical protein [Nostoc sp. FACHB-152]MBD2466357.1 hypothetical protein [Nostoc sp. FACHB-145]